MSKYSPWFNSYRLTLPNPGNRRETKDVRIFVFPYSGAGTSAFLPWARSLQGSDLDFIGIQLPGRENRIHEQPVTDLSVLLEQLLPAITPLLNRPFIFFGHSMGALIAFELCRALHQQNLPLPNHLLVSAFRSPDMPNPNRELYQLSDAGIIEGLREYGGTSESILNNKELMDLFIPLLRADFALHETYSYQEDIPLPCPITTLAGIYDTITRPEHMSNWCQQTTQSFQQMQYKGGHFFLHEHRDSINQYLQQIVMDFSYSAPKLHP